MVLANQNKFFEPAGKAEKLFIKDNTDKII